MFSGCFKKHLFINLLNLFQGSMAFRKAVKGTLIGGGALATAFSLSQFFEYRKNQVCIYSKWHRCCCSESVLFCLNVKLNWPILLTNTKNFVFTFHIHTVTPTGYSAEYIEHSCSHPYVPQHVLS